MNRVALRPSGRAGRGMLAPLLLAVALLAAGPARAEPGVNPLEPPDTSSPRATLTTFLEQMTEAYALFRRGNPSYQVHLSKAFRCLDLSEVPPTVVEDVSFESALRLKEVLDRIEIPALRSIPDTKEANAEELQTWTLPGTEITLALVSEGARTGEFLFSPDTVARNEEFYERTRHLPYQPGKEGAGYEAFSFTPGSWIPEGFIEGLPGWAKREFQGQQVWQWIGLVCALSLGVLITIAASRLSRRIMASPDREGDPTLGERLGPYLVPLTGIVLATLLQAVADDQLHLTGAVHTATTLALRAVLFIAGVRLVALVLGQVAEAVIVRGHLRPRGVDSQLVRLGFRFVIVVIAAWLIVEGANQLGLPAYSVLTGLGIGGLAVALAARDALANLFGSIMIMVDRPFRIGDWIKVGSHEGLVEDIGFRSTRLRTFYNSVVSIPSSEMMNASIDNMGMRRFRRVRTVLKITYDTPSEKIEAFVAGIKDIIFSHNDTRKDYFHVVLHDFGSHSLDILIYFFLRVSDWSAELVERQRVFLEILHLAESLGVKFAFPTRTLHIERAEEEEATSPADSGAEGDRAMGALGTPR